MKISQRQYYQYSDAVANGIIKAGKRAAKAAAKGFAYGAATVAVAAGIGYGGAKVYDYGKEKYDDYQHKKEIKLRCKEEGIPFTTYASAEQKLDSIDFVRDCAYLGVPVPQKPTSGDPMDVFIYDNNVSNIRMRAMSQKFIDVLESMTDNVRQASEK